jgi:hypothetical protein
MADLPNIFDPMSFYSTATSQSANYWLSLGINTILSTIIGGIVLIILVEIFSHKFGESIKPQNAFLAVLIANVVNNFGILGLAGSFLSAIPYLVLILPFLVWFVLIKLFFSQMKMLHVLLVAVIFFGLSVMLIPYLTAIVSGFIPVGSK